MIRIASFIIEAGEEGYEVRPTGRPTAPGGGGKSGNGEKVARGRWMMNGGVMVVLRAKPKYGGEYGGGTRPGEKMRKEDDQGARHEARRMDGWVLGWKMIRGCPRIVIYKRCFPRIHPLFPVRGREKEQFSTSDSANLLFIIIIVVDTDG